MPRPPKTTPQPEQEREFHILDPDATEIAGKRIKPDQTTILLTDSAASFYLASGAISTSLPEKDDAVEKARAARAEPPPPAEPEKAAEASEEAKPESTAEGAKPEGTTEAPAHTEGAAV